MIEMIEDFNAECDRKAEYPNENQVLGLAGQRGKDMSFGDFCCFLNNDNFRSDTSNQRLHASSSTRRHPNDLALHQNALLRGKQNQHQFKEIPPTLYLNTQSRFRITYWSLNYTFLRSSSMLLRLLCALVKSRMHDLTCDDASSAKRLRKCWLSCTRSWLDIAHTSRDLSVINTIIKIMV